MNVEWKNEKKLMEQTDVTDMRKRLLLTLPLPGHDRGRMSPLIYSPQAMSMDIVTQLLKTTKILHIKPRAP